MTKEVEKTIGKYLFALCIECIDEGTDGVKFTMRVPEFKKQIIADITFDVEDMEERK